MNKIKQKKEKRNLKQALLFRLFVCLFISLCMKGAVLYDEGENCNRRLIRAKKLVRNMKKGDSVREQGRNLLFT